MRAILAAVVVMYAIQGSINGLSDSTLPQLLNRNQAALSASEILAIVKLPAALKVFFAPLVDYGALKLHGGYKGLVLMLQVVAAAVIFNVVPLLQDALEVGGDVAAAQLRWPLFAIACANALSDLTLDAFALQQVPESMQHLPALCQVVGVFVGKTAAKSGLFLLMKHDLLSPRGFMQSLAILTLLAALGVGVTGVSRQIEDADEALGFFGMLRRFWVFSTSRRNMPHWLCYQLAMPAMYFHAVVVLPSRYEQLGFGGEDYAAYDLPLAVATVVLLVLASSAAEDASRPLSFVLNAYLGEVMVVAALLAQYWTWSGVATPGFTVAYSLLSKAQDLLFFVFEMFEFAFYGRVASLDPRLVATLVTMQASAFNFAEFFHCWLAPFLVDRFSICLQAASGFSCSFDAYPAVAVGLTLLSLVFLFTQRSAILAYQDIGSSAGWKPQQPLLRHKLTVGFILVSIGLFTLKEAML